MNNSNVMNELAALQKYNFFDAGQELDLVGFSMLYFTKNELIDWNHSTLHILNLISQHADSGHVNKKLVQFKFKQHRDHFEFYLDTVCLKGVQMRTVETVITNLPGDWLYFVFNMIDNGASKKLIQLVNGR